MLNSGKKKKKHHRWGIKHWMVTTGFSKTQEILPSPRRSPAGPFPHWQAGLYWKGGKCPCRDPRDSRSDGSILGWLCPFFPWLAAVLWRMPGQYPELSVSSSCRVSCMHRGKTHLVQEHFLQGLAPWLYAAQRRRKTHLPRLEEVAVILKVAFLTLSLPFQWPGHGISYFSPVTPSADLNKRNHSTYSAFWTEFP